MLFDTFNSGSNVNSNMKNTPSKNFAPFALIFTVIFTCNFFDLKKYAGKYYCLLLYSEHIVNKESIIVFIEKNAVCE